ncbi:DUF7948 domain-containing protein [Kaarinaea lacus]
MARISRIAGLVGGRHVVLGVVSTFTALFIISYFLSSFKYTEENKGVSSVAEFFAEFPMNFQSNDGAFAEDVKFFSKGYQYDLLFMEKEVLLNLYSNEQPEQAVSQKTKTKLSQISLEFIGAGNSPVIKGLEPLTFIDTKNNIRPAGALPSFTEVKYSNVFPGIDAYFRGKQKQLFYEFVLDADADTELLGMRVYSFDGGAGDIHIDSHGNITVMCRGKKMLIQKPVVYRLVQQKKQLVNGYFYVTSQNEIRFKAVELKHAI